MSKQFLDFMDSFGSWNLVIGNWKLEIRNWKLPENLLYFFQALYHRIS